MATVQERVDHLEDALHSFITSVGIEFNKLYNSQMRTEIELRAFKDEMRVFKDEMREYKEEGKRITREMNRQWGDLANKLGTIVEDLVYPSLTRIVKETMGLDVIDLMIRRKRKLPDGRVFEHDAIALTAELVILNSTQSTLRSADIDKFVVEIEEFRQIYPEYEKYPIVGILASLAVNESELNYAEKLGFLVIAVEEQIMEVKNHASFQPKRW